MFTFLWYSYAMLGYVRIDKGELKVREYEIYTGYYCGICKSIGKRYGQLPRMALSYDAAFLAVLLASLIDEPDEPKAEHCIGHRVKKKTIIRNKAIDYAGDVMLILAWYNLLDDANDEGKLYAKAALPLLKGKHKKLRRLYPKLCGDIERQLAELDTLEAEKCASLDMTAEAFAKIMESIFLEGLDKTGCRSQQNEEQMSAIGYHLGKWIYLIDAVDDIDEDIESGAYNPLIYRFSYDGQLESAEVFRKRIESILRFNLFHYLAAISNCIDSLDIRKNKGIIDNIVYFGLNRKTEEILKGDLNESV